MLRDLLRKFCCSYVQVTADTNSLKELPLARNYASKTCMTTKIPGFANAHVVQKILVSSLASDLSTILGFSEIALCTRNDELANAKFYLLHGCCMPKLKTGRHLLQQYSDSVASGVRSTQKSGWQLNGYIQYQVEVVHSQFWRDDVMENNSAIFVHYRA